MKYIITSLAFCLAGCSTVVPVTAKFPDKPADVEKCSVLSTVPDDVKLSELTATTAKNYSEYYECSLKNDTWNDWYNEQKRIFNGVSK